MYSRSPAENGSMVLVFRCNRSTFAEWREEVYVFPIPLMDEANYKIIYFSQNVHAKWLSAQKGTCGISYNAANMPFTASGLVPDLLFNPHGKPSRMTLGMILEMLLSRVTVHDGRMRDATPFLPVDREGTMDLLEKFGMNRFSNEVMYNGFTGEMLYTDIFIAPCFYQRLKHMVDDKIHCLTADHDVLTTDGWVAIDKIEMTHQIATLNSNGELEYHYPNKILKYPNFEGEMCCVASDGIDLNVTSNHRMYVSKPNDAKPRFVLAKNLADHKAQYHKSAKWKQSDYQFVLPSIPGHENKTVDMDAWLTFFGIWIQSGWINVDKNQIWLKQDNFCMKSLLETTIQKLDYPMMTDEDHPNCMYVTDAQLCQYMSSFNLPLPCWIWQLSQTQSRKFLDALMVHNDLTHPSKTFGDLLMRLTLHCG